MIRWWLLSYHCVRRNLPHKPSRYDVTSCLWSAAKWVKRVQPAKSLIIRPLFNLELPNFSLTYIPTQRTAPLDMTSPANSVRHLSTFEKTAKCCLRRHCVEFLVAQRFAWPNQLVGFLFILCSSWYVVFWVEYYVFISMYLQSWNRYSLQANK